MNRVGSVVLVEEAQEAFVVQAQFGHFLVVGFWLWVWRGMDWVVEGEVGFEGWEEFRGIGFGVEGRMAVFGSCKRNCELAQD